MKQHKHRHNLSRSEQRAEHAVWNIDHSPLLQREIAKIQHYYWTLLGRPEPTILDVYSWLYSFDMNTDGVLAAIDLVYKTRQKHKPDKYFYLTSLRVYSCAKRRKAMLKNHNRGIAKLERVFHHLGMDKRDLLEANDLLGVRSTKDALQAVRELLYQLRVETEQRMREQREQRQQQIESAREVVEITRTPRGRKLSLDELDNQAYLAAADYQSEAA